MLRCCEDTFLEDHDIAMEDDIFRLAKHPNLCPQRSISVNGMITLGI